MNTTVCSAFRQIQINYTFLPLSLHCSYCKLTVLTLFRDNSPLLAIFYYGPYPYKNRCSNGSILTYVWKKKFSYETYVCETVIVQILHLISETAKGGIISISHNGHVVHTLRRKSCPRPRNHNEINHALNSESSDWGPKLHLQIIMT